MLKACKRPHTAVALRVSTVLGFSCCKVVITIASWILGDAQLVKNLRAGKTEAWGFIRQRPPSPAESAT